MNYILDIECYRNYFLMVFLPIDGSEPCVFEKHNDIVTINTVGNVDWSGTFITFNGITYDFPMWGGLWAGKSNTELKDMSDAIISGRMMPWDVEREFGISIPPFNHIDIIQVLPGTASLKIYGGRIGFKKLQDLPIHHDAIITDDDLPLMRQYCQNDDEVTNELLEKVTPQIKLREQMGLKYNIDLRSKSDAQIAEAVFSSEYVKRTGKNLNKPGITQLSYRYTPPSFVKFKTEQMNEVLRNIMMLDIEINPKSGQPIEPDYLKTPLKIGQRTYKMGLGGLHSVDKPASFYSTDEGVKHGNGHTYFDIDAAAFYPWIILNAGFYPAHMGEVFLDIYREFVESRMAAKLNGDKVTDATVKIIINGTFGKLGSKYSKLYAPDLLFHTTITGQLCLLMLIEQLGDNVVSANTDGIMVVVPNKTQWVDKIVFEWEQLTGFKMEYTEYKSIHRRDVNNYIAIKPDGSIKGKGVFAETGLAKNPANSIIYSSIKKYFLDNTPVAETTMGCRDITQFLSLRTVNGGAKWGNEILGKSVRWYHSWLSVTPIQYQKNGNKVPLSDGCVVLQELPDTFPTDVHHQWYIDEANKLLEKMK